MFVCSFPSTPLIVFLVAMKKCAMTLSEPLVDHRPRSEMVWRRWCNGGPRGYCHMRKNEHLTLPPSRAFMDDITILVPSKIATDGLLQRYYDLFTSVRMKDKPKKSRSLSLVGGSVRKIHFKIGGDTIPTVGEKPVKSLRRLYSIPLTDRHRGTEVQKVALKGFKSIDKTCLPGKMKAWCY